MTGRHSLNRVSSTLLLIAVMVLSLSACSESWKEEVQLSDGRIIVVDRELIREAGGDEWASNRGGTKPKEDRIRFADPDGSGKMIQWRSTKISPQTWPEIPLFLDMVSGKPIVFSIVAISKGCEIYSKYVYKNGGWIEEQLPEQFDQRVTNLLFGDHKDMPAFIDLNQKRIRNNFIGVRDRYLQLGPTREVCG